jgi:hypothetical protein
MDASLVCAGAYLLAIHQAERRSAQAQRDTLTVGILASELAAGNAVAGQLPSGKPPRCETTG